MNFISFDLDGTLADTAEDLINAANLALDHLGLGQPLDPAVDGGMGMQLGGRAMLKRGFEILGKNYNEAYIESLYPDLLNFYRENLCVKSRLFNGVEGALDEFLSSGYRLGVCTNKPEELARNLLSELGVLDRFHNLVGADTLSVRKPHPEPLLANIRDGGGERQRAILIGDSQTDRACANNANVALGLVTFGPEGENVRNWGADVIVPGFDVLPSLMADYFR